ncbi:MAG: ABC transporter ATP-binding protein [Cellulosilyticaceae bacterium]
MSQKEERKKPQYNVFQNTVFTVRKLWEWNKASLFYIFGNIPVIVLLPLCTVYLPKVIVGEIENGQTPIHMMGAVGGIAIAMLVLSVLQQLVQAKMSLHTLTVTQKMQGMIASKAMAIPYEQLDQPKTQVMIRKAYDLAAAGETEGMLALPVTFTTIIANALGFMIYTGILGSLSPWIIVFIIGSTIISYFVSTAVNKWVFNNRDKWLKLDLKLAYLTYKSGSFETAKDIRLYRMKQWFHDAFAHFMKRRIKWTVKMQLFYFLNNGVEAFFVLLRDGIAYGYLIYLVFNSNLSVADFVLYFGVIGGFSNWCMTIIGSLAKLNGLNFNICDLRTYLSLPEYAQEVGRCEVPDTESGPFEIALKNVSYCYESEEAATIKQINLVIKPGEKIAVVGANGAGKTTFVKLIAGLYTPTSGQVYVDGKNIADYNKEDYYRLFAPVFQDLRLLPISIKQNITLCEATEVDYPRLAICMRLSGMDEVVAKFAEGLDTLLVRDMNEKAVQLSGGEEQKLMLARALYKDAPIMILDEPTAALDPIAENAMYLKYNELTKDKTSLFISHRLASTRFCDRIILMENGEILEVGTHEALLARGGKYAEMFEVQAQYYKESETDEEGGQIA